MEKTGIFLLNMGGPENQDQIQPFLFQMLQDKNIVPLPGPDLIQRYFARFISRSRREKVAIHYELLGGGSPLNRITAGQCRELEETLNDADGPNWLVRPCLRYVPGITMRSVEEMAAFRPERLILLSLYPFFSYSTTRSALADVQRLWHMTGRDGGVKPVEIDSWSDFEPYLAWLSGRIQAELQRLNFTPETTWVLFSAHGLPVSFIKRGDPYLGQVETAMTRLRAMLPEWRVRCSFQSKFGPGRWLEPYTHQVLRDLARGGADAVLMVPLGFVAENLETLFEMDHLYGQLALQHGIGRFARLACPNADPEFVGILRDLVREQVR